MEWKAAILAEIEAMIAARAGRPARRPDPVADNTAPSP
jgi:hypothetical protein